MVRWPSNPPKDLVLVVLLLFPWWVVLWYQTRRAIGYPLTDVQDCLSVKRKPIRRLVCEQPGRAWYPERGKQAKGMRAYDLSGLRRKSHDCKGVLCPPSFQGPCFMEPRNDEMKPSQYPTVWFTIRL